MDQRTELSEFLRSRRARLQPEDVGMAPHGGRRRVPGLRREELAQLAGVSATYYTRLEQGAGRGVSTAVLDAIATALRLTRAEREHLYRLARPGTKTKTSSTPAAGVRPAVQYLLDSMDSTPAYVLGPRLDIIAWNHLACALLGDFPAMPPKQRNMAWQIFLQPQTQELYVDWTGKAAAVTAMLRHYAGAHPHDPQLTALVGELSLQSEEFCMLWAAHNVNDKCFGTKHLRHPVVGHLTLLCETLTLPGDRGQQLLTYCAEPGTSSAESLRLLASWSLEETEEHTPHTSHTGT
ncbi:helix-turn-helix transcriptional regulator [Streptomyces sp. NPDC093097]|uniref:helix-turn-helix transcriptional regulator n=1 Tax=Streptomyces sp. NPDC093097 TaxID=3366027 RepID=UPI0037F49677